MTSFSFGWKVLLAILLLFTISNGHEARAENLEEILKNKIPVDQGKCYFKNEKFFAFASGSWMSPSGVVDKAEHCFVFAEISPSNRTWFVLFDKIGFPKEVIKWDYPIGPDKLDNFESIWKPEPKSGVIPDPKPVQKPKGIEI